MEASLRLHDKHIHLQLDLSGQEPPPEESLLLCGTRPVSQRHRAIPWLRRMAVRPLSRRCCWFSFRPNLRPASHDFRGLPGRHGCLTHWFTHSTRVPYWCSSIQAKHRDPSLRPHRRSHLHGNMQCRHIIVHDRWVRPAITVPYRSHLHLRYCR